MYIPCTTCLHIPLAHSCLYYNLLSPQYTILHMLFDCTSYSSLFLRIIFVLFFTYIYVYSHVLCYIFHCPLSGPDLIYISLLIMFCIIEYVMNKTLNLEETFFSEKVCVVSNPYSRKLAEDDRSISGSGCVLMETLIVGSIKQETLSAFIQTLFLGLTFQQSVVFCSAQIWSDLRFSVMILKMKCELCVSCVYVNIYLIQLHRC